MSPHAHRSTQWTPVTLVCCFKILASPRAAIPVFPPKSEPARIARVRGTRLSVRGVRGVRSEAGQHSVGGVPVAQWLAQQAGGRTHEARGPTVRRLARGRRAPSSPRQPNPAAGPYLPAHRPRPARRALPDSPRAPRLTGRKEPSRQGVGLASSGNSVTPSRTVTPQRVARYAARPASQSRHRAGLGSGGLQVASVDRPSGGRGSSWSSRPRPNGMSETRLLYTESCTTGLCKSTQPREDWN